MLTPRRDDARRNREAILRVADAAFADGPDLVPLDEIARRAGLGRATVYRHFRNRHALAAAVAAYNIGELRRVVGAAEGEGRSFRELLHHVLSTQAAMRPLAAVIRELPNREQRQHVDTLIGVLTPPFRRAQHEGHLRPDVEPADLALVMTMLDAGIAAGPSSTAHGAEHAAEHSSEHDAAVRRLIAVLLDGLFTPTGSAGQGMGSGQVGGIPSTRAQRSGAV